VRADRQEAREFARRLVLAAEETGDLGFSMQAQLAMTLTSYWGGEFSAALAHADKVIELYDEQIHAHHAMVYGGDPRVYGYVYRGMSQCFLGYPTSGLESLAIARRYAASQPPFTRVGARAFEVQLLNLTGVSVNLAESALGMCAEAREQGFPLFVGVGAVHAGWARVLRGDVAAGLEEIDVGIADFASTGAKLNLPYFHAHLAKACAAAGDDTRARRVLDEALEMTRTSLDAYFMPELLCLYAELELRHGEIEAGVARLWHATELAREQGSRLLELRALCRLVQLAPDETVSSVSRQQLARLYRSFTEGHETADLRAAEQLLREHHAL
jgi:hypothetical protein